VLVNSTIAAMHTADNVDNNANQIRAKEQTLRHVIVCIAEFIKLSRTGHHARDWREQVYQLYATFSSCWAFDEIGQFVIKLAQARRLQHQH